MTKFNQIRDNKAKLALAKQEGRTIKVVNVPFDAKLIDAPSEEEEDTPTRMRRKYQPGFHQETKKVEVIETHATESRINGLWNMALFEIKALRDFFVEQTILPRAV
mgnify:CR=1 FL=1